MSLKDRTKYNAYMNDYMKRRWVSRRASAEEHLGGLCCYCGATHDLQFHHEDPLTKTKTVARMSSMSNIKFWAEVSKCILLCSDCHRLQHKQMIT